ncbi:MAG: flagellar motor switch protein FliM [Alphaproteobacteria bacterium]|nr:flagellar motor switch protein FliM [Alphaproteobacteria bacterium]
MPSSRRLTTEEVDALIEGLGGGAEPAGPSIISAGAEVRSFQFGADELSLLGDYYALRMINERFCRYARSVFLPMLRVQPRMSSFPPEVKTFDEYAHGVESFVSLTNSRMEELRGAQLTVLPPHFIALLTNSYYGGSVTAMKRKSGEFTATEQRVIEIVTEGLNEALFMAWRDLMPVHFTVQGREENIQFASFVDGGDTVIVCTFLVQLPKGDPVSFDVIYPLQTLKPIASQLRSRVQSDKSGDNLSWRQKLERAILNIPLTVTARLAQPTVSMRSLIQMQQGHVFPIQIVGKIDVMVEGRPIFEADLGEMNGQAALNLRKRIKKPAD